MRYTERYETYDVDDIGWKNPITKYIVVDHSSPYIDKLGQLEDIEDELGVPLEIFLSALKDGIRIAEIERNPTLSDWKKGKYSVQPVYNSKPTDYDANGELVRLPPRWEFYYNFHAIQSEEGYRMGYEPHIFSDYVVVSEFGKTWGLEKKDLGIGGK